MDERDAGVPAAETPDKHAWFAEEGTRQYIEYLQNGIDVKLQEIVALDKQLAKNLIELNNADDLLTAERERSAKLQQMLEEFL
jgi:hypothetical protein